MIDISDRYAYEGPRTPTQAEWDATRELNRSIFFKDNPCYNEALRAWPMYLRPDTRENTFAMFYKGKPVSCIVRLSRDMMVHGQKLRMGFIGGVCTHPEHRKKGLAGTILDATLRRLADDGVDFVYISGARSLYYRTGANRIGGFSEFFLTSDARKSVDRKEFDIRKATPSDVEVLHSLNEGEQTRFARDVLDYELVVQHGHCSGGRCTFNIIESDAKPVAYLAVRDVVRKEGRWSQRVIEFAGDREAIFSASVDVAEELGSNGHLIVGVRTGEKLAERLRSIGVEHIAGRIGGTVKVLNFTRTMEKLRPYLGHQLGSSFAETLEFAAGNGRYVATGEGGSLEIDGEANMLWTLLGSPPRNQSQNVRAMGTMEKALEVCLPIPLPALELNTI